MTTIKVPERHERLFIYPLFCQINPLPRPRINQHKNRIYQPRDNQQELYQEFKHFSKPYIKYPVIVDLYINFTHRHNKEAHDWPINPVYGDEDNLRKAVMDALVLAEILSDDRFIMGGQTYKCFGEDDFAFVEIYSIKPLRTDLDLKR